MTFWRDHNWIIVSSHCSSLKHLECALGMLADTPSLTVYRTVKERQWCCSCTDILNYDQIWSWGWSFVLTWQFSLVHIQLQYSSFYYTFWYRIEFRDTEPGTKCMHTGTYGCLPVDYSDYTFQQQQRYRYIRKYVDTNFLRMLFFSDWPILAYFQIVINRFGSPMTSHADRNSNQRINNNHSSEETHNHIRLPPRRSIDEARCRGIVPLFGTGTITASADNRSRIECNRCWSADQTAKPFNVSRLHHKKLSQYPQ